MTQIDNTITIWPNYDFVPDYSQYNNISIINNHDTYIRDYIVYNTDPRPVNNTDQDPRPINNKRPLDTDEDNSQITKYIKL